MKFQNRNDAQPFLDKVTKAILKKLPDAEFEDVAGRVTVKNPDTDKTHNLLVEGGDYGSNWVAEEHDVPVILKHIGPDAAAEGDEAEGDLDDEHEDAEAEGGGSEEETAEDPEEEAARQKAPGPDDAGSDKDPGTKEEAEGDEEPAPNKRTAIFGGNGKKKS